jgi:hypothetical protein
VNATRLSALLVVGIPLVYAACGGDKLTLPSVGEPAHIVVIAGSPQSGRVGDQLAAPLVVKVTDTQDRPVAGATVNFTFDDAASGGSAQPASGTTNGDGEASSIIRLGPRVGPMSGHATVPVPEGTVPVTVPFTLTALSADAFGIAAVSGEGQNGQVGATLPQPLVVQVSDNFGNPIPNVTVDWNVTGGGSVNPSSPQTDVNGRVSAERTLGNTAGEWTTVATATGLAGSPVTFIHQVSAGNASRVEIVSGNGQNAQAGTQLSDDLVVRVLDADDNPISQRAVEWVIGEGGGTANPARSNTDGQGYARTSWTLGPAPGRNTLNAVVSGVGEGRVTFTATGTSTGSTTRITSMNPDQSIVGQRVAVSVSVSGNGGTPTGSVTVNGESVAQPCTITLANGSGSCEIAFTAPGNHRVTATYGGDSRFGGSSDDANHRVNAAPNLSPITQADDYSTSEDTPLTVSAADGVLKNDQDPEGGPLTAVNASNPPNGSVALNPDGSFTYTPDADFNGDDTFTYQARDNAGNETTGTVTVHVAPVNDAPSFTMSNVQLNVSPGAQITQTEWATNISPGAANEAGQSLTFIVTTDKDNLFSQAPVISPDGTLMFTTSGPDSGSELITVTVTLQDNAGGISASQQFTINTGPGLMARQGP